MRVNTVSTFLSERLLLCLRLLYETAAFIHNKYSSQFKMIGFLISNVQYLLPKISHVPYLGRQ